MNREVVIAKIKRQQAEIQEMLAALQEEGDKFPRIAKALNILRNNSLGLISTLEDDSLIIGPGLDVSPEMAELKKGVEKVKRGVQKMKAIEKNIAEDLEDDFQNPKNHDSKEKSSS